MKPNELVHPKKISFSPSVREISVIQKLADVGIAGFEFLRKYVLADCTVKHAQLVLRTLVKEGYLVESHCDCGASLAWRPNLASSRTRKLIGEVKTLRSTVPHFRTAFRHNELLSDLREIYLSSPAVKSWTMEGELKGTLLTNTHRLSTREHADKLLGVPDGLILLKRSDRDFKIAFELELTQKSAKRIKKKLENYITSRDFDFVFFVLAGEPLKNRFIDLYREVLRTSSRVEFSVRNNGIYFAELSSVRKLGLAAPFSSLKNTIAISDFH